MNNPIPNVTRMNGIFHLLSEKFLSMLKPAFIKDIMTISSVKWVRMALFWIGSKMWKFEVRKKARVLMIISGIE